MSAHHLEDQALLKRIETIFTDTKGRYGSPRVHRELRRQGIRVGRKRVARLMRQGHLKARAARVYPRKPGNHQFYTRIPNRILDLDTIVPNKVLLGDVTYLKIQHKQVYLAGVLDRSSRRVLGWALGSQRDLALTRTALQHALQTRPPQPGTMFHSDRGSEYTGYGYGRLLDDAGMIQSTNRPRHMNDNAIMESFWHTLKSELYHGTKFTSEKQLLDQLEEFFHCYNTKRIHSSLDYKTPLEYESALADA